MLVWGCVAHLVVMLAEAVPRWTPLWAARILALETALCFPLTFRVSAHAPALCDSFMIAQLSARLRRMTAAPCAGATLNLDTPGFSRSKAVRCVHLLLDGAPCFLQIRFVHALPITALKCFTSLTILPQVKWYPAARCCQVPGQVYLADVCIYESQVLGCAMHSTAAMRTCTLLAQIAQVIRSVVWHCRARPMPSVFDC